MGLSSSLKYIRQRGQNEKIFLLLAVALLLLAALSVGTTLGKFSSITINRNENPDKTLKIDKTEITINPNELWGKSDPENPDRPGIENEPAPEESASNAESAPASEDNSPTTDDETT